MKKIIIGLLFCLIPYVGYSQDTRTTKDSLLLEMPTGVAGAITAQDIRDFVISIYAHAASASPTVTDDENSGFSIGDRWVNTSTNTVYVCVDNTAGSATWVSDTYDGTESIFDGWDKDASDDFSGSDITGNEAAFDYWDKSVLDDNRVSYKHITSNYILSLADTSQEIVANSTSTIVITVPLETTADFPDGTFISFVRRGSGDVIIKPASGVTLNSIFDDTATAGDSLRLQSSPYLLKKYDQADEWYGYGDAK